MGVCEGREREREREKDLSVWFRRFSSKKNRDSENFRVSPVSSDHLSLFFGIEGGSGHRSPRL